MIRLARVLMAMVITIAVAGACAAIIEGHIVIPGRGGPAGTQQHETAARACGREPSVRRYVGVITLGPPGGTVFERFVTATRVHPTLIAYFVPFGSTWDPVPACRVVHAGALPLIQMNLRRVSMAHIAAGGYRRYLTKYGQQIAQFGARVALSIGHEMNGNWYPWGWQHAPASRFVRVWRAIHNEIMKAGARNVIWTWTVNRAVPPATDPRPWWPGKKYVDWVGIDGHITTPVDNFKTVFGPTISEIRAVTNDPILLAETAIRPGATRPAQIAAFFKSVATNPGMIGLVWFELTGRFHWQIAGDAAAAAAYHKAALAMERANGGQGRSG